MKILLTRNLKDSETFIKKLSKRDVDYIISPLLSFKNDPLGQEKLTQIDHSLINAYIFTSSRALEYIDTEQLDKNKLCFAVGHKTAHKLKELNFNNICIGTSDAEELEKLIIKKVAPGNKVLYIGINDPSYKFQKLERFNLVLEHISVYSSIEINSLSPEALRAFEQKELNAVVFFSSKAVRAFKNFLDIHRLHSQCANLSAICLSPNIAKNCYKMPFKDVKHSTKVSEDDLANLIKNNSPINKFTVIALLITMLLSIVAGIYIGNNLNFKSAPISEVSSPEITNDIDNPTDIVEENSPTSTPETSTKLPDIDSSSALKEDKNTPKDGVVKITPNVQNNDTSKNISLPDNVQLKYHDAKIDSLQTIIQSLNKQVTQLELKLNTIENGPSYNPNNNEVIIHLLVQNIERAFYNNENYNTDVKLLRTMINPEVVNNNEQLNQSLLLLEKSINLEYKAKKLISLLKNNSSQAILDYRYPNNSIFNKIKRYLVELFQVKKIKNLDADSPEYIINNAINDLNKYHFKQAATQLSKLPLPIKKPLENYSQYTSELIQLQNTIDHLNTIVTPNY